MRCSPLFTQDSPHTVHTHIKNTENSSEKLTYIYIYMYYYAHVHVCVHVRVCINNTIYDCEEISYVVCGCAPG